jgi:polycystin 1L2
VIINGDINETSVRPLQCSTRQVFRRGGVDSFVMAVNRPLGNLNFLRVWHDNSGKSEMASWFLKYIIVHDVQTREKFYFICDKWLAVERADGKIDRTLPVGNEKQVMAYKYKSRNNMNNGHVWLSVFTKPVQSTFARLDRVGVCFVLAFVFMLVNIIYFDASSSASTGDLVIGPFNFSIEQVNNQRLKKFLGSIKFIKLILFLSLSSAL